LLILALARSSAEWRKLAEMSLFADLDAFLQEHGRCGDLDAAVEDDRVWTTCTCGATICRNADRD